MHAVRLALQRLHADSLIAWAIALLIAVLAVSQLITLVIISTMRSDSLAVVEHLQIADRVADMVRVLEATPPALRSSQLANFGGETLAANWSQQPTVSEPGEHSWREVLFSDAIGAALGDFAPPHRAVLKRATLGESSQRQPTRVLLISIALADGSWLNCRVPLADPADMLGPRVMAAIAGSGMVILLLAVWAVRRLTHPLTVLAHAAEQLGRDVNAKPLPETGSREMRQATRAFNTMQERLRRLINDRLQLVAAISHDLRTPLTRLRLRAELNEEASKRRKTQQDLAEMEAMIEATLCFARDEATPEPRVNVDLVSLVESVCDDLPGVSVQIGDEVPQRLTLCCQQLAMRRCVGNLVSNAVKYGERAFVALSMEADAILISVEDEGPGIALADQLRVFEPFQRLETSRSRDSGGVGLGLTIARATARAHGGDVQLANRAAGGLRATIRLPTAIQQSTPAERVTEPAGNSRSLRELLRARAASLTMRDQS